MYKLYKLTLIFLFPISFYFCTSIMCGELTDKWKQKIEEVNKKAIDFKVRYIPCEFHAIDMVFLSEQIDTTLVYSAHKILYNEKSKIGWQVIKVYDRNNKYLFTHRYENSIYVQGAVDRIYGK